MKHKKTQIKTIIFDLDGTIFDIKQRDAYARYQALNDLGYHISLKDVRRHYHLGTGSMGLLKELGIKLSPEQEKDYIETSFKHFADRDNARRFTRIHPDAYNALTTLSKKYKLVLVTSRNSLSATEEELERFKIKQLFTLIVTREVAAKYYGAKQIPLLPFREQRTKLYKCAIALTGLKTENMLCVGDAVTEIEPARKLGMKAIGVLTGFSNEQDMKKAKIPTVKSLTELTKTLQ